MRLVRIEATRFGRLEQRTLAPLKGGLNVVLGPNEAGKSSFTDLVRHILFGFPTLRDSEAGYHTAAGKRQGRLVFADAEGEWVVERTEGSHGGPVAVSALTGPERADLLARITSGVSRDSYRVVFGFGLEEMAEIESGRGTAKDVLSRLYAASTGLAVSPQDIRRDLASGVEELFKPGGSKPVINSAKREISELRSRLRELEAEADRFAEDRERLAELDRDAAIAREARDRARGRARELAGDAERASAAADRLGELDERRSRLEAQRAELAEKAGAVQVDERVLDTAAELTALLEDVSWLRERLRGIDDRRAEAAGARDRAQAALDSVGADPRAAEAFVSTPQLRADLEAGREQLAALAARAADSSRDAGEAELHSDVSGTAMPARSHSLIGWALIAAGLVAAVAGLVLSQWIAAGLGLVVLVLGGVLIWQAREARPADGVIGEQYARDAAVATERARRDTEALETARVEWREWLAGHGLSDAGTDPAVVTEYVDALARWRDERLSAEREESQAASDESEARQFIVRLAAAAPYEPGLADTAPEDVVAIAARLRASLDENRAASAERTELERRLSEADSQAAELAAEREAIEASLAEILDRHGLQTGSVAALQGLVESAQEDEEQALSTFEAIESDRVSLATTLEGIGDEDTMAATRLELTSASERLARAAEEYAVLAVATALMDEAIAYYQQERQPEVVRRAAEIFSRMTDGRYERIVIPTDETEITAYRPSSEPVPSSQLSQGTQEQLYLALRIALIEQLDDVGPGLPVLMDDVLANFDPERKQGAARAIHELASHRQVVFFTCHPDTVELLGSSGSEPALLTLDRC